MTSPDRLYPDQPIDFEARVRILRADEGGRRTMAYNGIRWDFAYAQDQPRIVYMGLYPDFYDPATGNSWRELPLPADEWLHARVSILWEPARPTHQARLRVGTSFYYCEGSRAVAEGTVTRLLGLLEPQPHS